MDDLNALGYTKSIHHGMGMMMRPLGLMLTDWQHDLSSPLGQALMLAIAFGRAAGYFFALPGCSRRRKRYNTHSTC